MFLWATDLHLNYFSNEYITNFGKSLSKYNCTSLIISGDISLGNRLENDLKVLSDAIQVPIYYVLGNHDYWYSSFDKIDQLTKTLETNSIINLNDKYVRINNNTSILGFNGWYDCGYGTIDPNIQMSDWFKIEDFKDKDPIKISKERSNSYLNFKEMSNKAKLNGFVNQLIVTHIPPFKELVIDKDLAFYSSYNAGLTLRSLDLNKIVCLSGHTHNSSFYKENNISCYVGEACRGKPDVCGIINENLDVNLFYHNQ